LSSRAEKPHAARFRFYAELNDFLAASKRQRETVYRFDGAPSIKDAIEAQGVPHPEVDLIVVGDASVGFDYRLRPGDRVAVYPVFEGLDISPILRLRARPLRDTRFVVDVHLGRLARYLRLLGFDTLYDRDVDDAHLIAIQRDERRIILTRDRDLLKAGDVTHGYWVRAVDPDEQLDEVVARFDLAGALVPFSRCLVCNGEIGPANEPAIASVPPRARRRHDEFFQCADCARVYWKGSHYDRLLALVRRAGAEEETGLP
jgi:uncharacterized protein with PIN domain